MIQRCVVKGDIATVVQTRSIYTADITESGGDTYDVLWQAYLAVLYGEITSLWAYAVETTSYEIQIPAAGHWEPVLEVPFAYSGSITGEQIANAVALVLIGKAAGLRHMGRKFISALAEGGTNGNVLASSKLSYAVAALAAYVTPFTGIGGGTLIPGITDRTGTFHAFVGGVVSTLLGSIRRRKPGVGI